MSEPATLLICTVGGSPEPVVAALKKWNALRIRFVHTPQTKEDIAGKILPRARAGGIELDAGRYDLLELPDGQDLAICIDTLRQLTTEVREWAERGEGFRVVVDFTGGTKCMSAAVALQASRWPCQFSYVGGESRTKQGVGVVVSGTERVVYQENPWDALGHQAVDDFATLFDQLAFADAARLASSARTRVTRQDRKRELNVLEQLAKAFDAWDRFDHKNSMSAFVNVEKAANDLRAVLGSVTADQVLAGVNRYKTHLDCLGVASAPSRHHVIDLLANARRRGEENRWDDGVARLYRGIEAVAQVALKERHRIESTARVPLDRLSDALRSVLAPRAKDGVVALGLQDAYALLASFDDALAHKFAQAGLNGPQSPLTGRNRSILAHGFEPVSPAVFRRLWEAAANLAEIQETDLPSFIRIGRASSVRREGTRDG
jgi:CRISPR-associated protein (TIGR02710 family)